MPALLDFFDLAFAGFAGFGEAVAFGDSLFGGPPPEGEAEPERISVTQGFHPHAMRAVADSLPASSSADVQLGAVLAAAIVACDLRHNGPCTAASLGDIELDAACILAGPPCDGVCEDVIDADEQMAACLRISLAEVERACAGLQASIEMRQAAEEPMRLAASLLRPARPLGQHALLAAAVAPDAAAAARGGGLGDADLEPASAAEFAALQRLWELLKLDPAQAKRQLAVGPGFVLALLGTRCAPSTVRRLEEQMRLLSAAGPRINGKAVAETEGVPPHLRGQLISQLHVLCRLRGEAPELSTATQ
eukprot:1796840-Prymnesium_polylepis.1